MTKLNRKTTMDKPGSRLNDFAIVISQSARDRCPLCGAPRRWQAGPQVFAMWENGLRLVCRKCARGVAPVLVALIEASLGQLDGRAMDWYDHRESKPYEGGTR